MKKPRVLSFAKSYQEDLARLASRPEFKVFLKLIEIEERNIIVQAFKINSGDLMIALKKSHLEGRIYEARKFRKTFDEAMKAGEK